MKWLLLLIISTSVMAQDKCERVNTSLKEIERKLQNAKIAGCGQLDPKTMGLPELSGSSKTVFDGMKCQSLGSIDTMLGNIETQLVLLDELKDFREQTVATKRTLEKSLAWNKTTQDLSKQFAKDVTLGAAIQNTIENPGLKALMSDPSINGPKWGEKLNSFCQGQGANAASPLCGMWKSFGANSEMKAINTVDFYSFLDELRPLLKDGEISAEKKAELLAMLRLEKNGKPTDFKTYQSDLDKVKLYDTLSSTNIRNLNPEQTQFIRNQTLRVPDEKDNMTALRSLVSRLSESQDRLKAKSASVLFADTMRDATNRHEARLKARWSSLFGKLAQGKAIPCLDTTGDSFPVCMQVEWDKLPKTSLETQDTQFQQALFLGAQQLKENRNSYMRCMREDVVQAWVKGDAAPAECEKDKTLSRPGLDLNRQVLLALRDRLRTQEEQRLRFRDFAVKQLKDSCQTSTVDYVASNKCQGLPGEIEFGPAIALIADSMPIFHEGMTASSEINTNDCPIGKQDEYTLLCNMAFNRDGNSGPTGPKVQPRVSPTTLSTDAPKRKSDPIVADTLAKVANEIANTWANNRMNQMMQPTYTFTYPTYTAMPYSQSLSLKMSDYVMATATTYGGYGTYYKCSTCGYGTGATSFNSYWGIGGATSTGAVSSLSGTSLSSRFFSSSSSAGFVSF